MKSLHRASSIVLASALSFGLLVSCKSTVKVPGATTEGIFNDNFYANVHIAAGGRGFQLKTPDGKPLDGVLLQAGGVTYRTQDGNFHLPASELQKAKDVGKGFFHVFVAGYAPAQVWIGQATDDIVVAPVQTLIHPVQFQPQGGTLISPDRSVTIKLPPQLIAKPNTPVALSEYTPPITAQTQTDFNAQRATLLAAINKGAKPYHLEAAACVDPEQPLPCSCTQSLGLLITVNGPIADGTFSISLDLAALLNGWDGTSVGPWLSNPGAWQPFQISRAQAAARILETLGNVDTAGTTNWLGVLAAPPTSISLAGTVLTFPVTVTSPRPTDGIVQTLVTDILPLGTEIEVTIVDTTAATLPAAASLPEATVAVVASQVTGGISSFISQDGIGLISNNGGAVLANGGGSVVANNGGSLTGTLRVPFAPGIESKFGLLAAPTAGYVDYIWPNVTIDAESPDGTVYATTSTDISGHYSFTGLPATTSAIELVAKPGGYTLRYVEGAPGNSAEAGLINCGSTLAASNVLNNFDSGASTYENLVFSALSNDTNFEQSKLNQANANTCVEKGIYDDAVIAGNYMTAAGYVSTAITGVTTFAGDATIGNTDAPAGQAVTASFQAPAALAVDGAGNVYICDDVAARIRKIAPNRAVTTLNDGALPGYADVGPGGLSTAQFQGPSSIVVLAGGVLAVADTGNNCIREIKPDGSVITLAGSTPGGYADAVATDTASAQFQGPCGLTADASGNLYIADTGNNRIRKIATSGAVTTLAGSGTAAYANGTGAVAQFNGPTGLACDTSGNLYIADTNNNCIRKLVLATGAVTTLSGTTTGSWADGTAATARFHAPVGISYVNAGGSGLVATGDLLISDSGNHRLRKVKASTGAATTLTGDGTPAWRNALLNLAELNAPLAAMVVPGYGILVADSANHMIRRVQ